MRYLALDVGNRRVGVAVGNSELRLATPLAVIERESIARDAEQLRALVDKYDVDALVVGLPCHSDNTASEQEQLTREYAEQLRPRLALPLIYHDERYSTFAALAQQRARGIEEKRGRATIDASAAAVILQDYLDHLDEGSTRQPDDAG